MRTILPAIAAAALFLAPLFAADEKVDPGPAPTPEEQAAAADLTKRGALVQPLAAGINWRYVNFRGIEKAEGALALLAKIPTIVELDLSGAQFKPEELAAIAGLKNLQKLNLA